MWGKLVFATAAAIGLLQHPGAAKVVEFNDAIARSYADDGIKFLAEARDSVLKLMAMDEYYSKDDLIKCSVSDPKEKNSGKVTVLLAISKCLDDETMKDVHEWVDKVKQDQLSYFKNGEYVDIEFQTTLVPGACQEHSEKNLHGRTDAPAEKAETLLSDDVQTSDLARISDFAKYGRVLESMPSGKNEESPIAVISFVNNEKSYEEVQQYERVHKIEKTFNFQICKRGKSCDGKYKNCVKLHDSVELFMYNPFTVSRSFECHDLTDGVPVTYLDKHGERQCYCSCPVGTERREDAYGGKRCVPVEPETCPCEWSKEERGYRFAVQDPIEKCSFNHISDWGVHVAFPMDNYVADGRKNAMDGGEYLTSGPHVQLSTTAVHNRKVGWHTLSQLLHELEAEIRSYDPDVFPHNWDALLAKYPQLSELGVGRDYSEPGSDEALQSFDFTWREYQNDRRAKIDALQFDKYGKYNLKLYAKDYDHDATCKGCLTIVDKYRPQSTTQCPASFCDNTTSLCDGHKAATSELTMEHLQRAHDLVGQFYEYQEKAKNDACSVDNRCDEEYYGIKRFYEEDYCKDDPYESGKQCFDPEAVGRDFLSDKRSMQNPLVTVDEHAYEPVMTVKQDENPVPEGRCTRCCSYRVKLREWWTDYMCGDDYDVKYCEGLASQKCEFNQCLTLHGDTLASVSAHIRTEHVKESEKVLKHIVQEGFQTTTQIHRSLQCTDLGKNDGKCDFSAKVSSLIETNTKANLELSDKVKIEDYVFWRYKVGDEGEWKLLGGEGEEDHTFKEAQTQITIEAWTNCGRARRFFFYVHLHPNTDIAVCDHFSDMWYQTSVSRVLDADSICSYPQSDFAELTFDFRPFAGLQYSREKTRMNVTNVQCWMSVDGKHRGQILLEQSMSPEIIRRYAVELVNKESTKRVTEFSVTCDFTYTRYDKSKVVKPCSKTFSVTDCEGPKIDIPDGECRHDACANKNRPGPFEACGGYVVRHNAQRTFLTSGERRCCQSCATARTECVPVLGLPDPSEDIKRCVPQVTEGLAYGGPDEPAYGDVQEEQGDEVPNDEVYPEEDNAPAPEEGGAYGAYHDEPHQAEESTPAPTVTKAAEHQATALMSAVREGAKKAANSTWLVTGVAGSALVALVALVAAKIRGGQRGNTPVVEDAYYPLLH